MPGVRAGQRPGTAGRSQRQRNFKVSRGGIHRQLHFFFSESVADLKSIQFCKDEKKERKLTCYFPSPLFLNEETSLVAQMVKNLSAMWKTWVRSLGWEDLLEKEMGIFLLLFSWQ